ncbi:MAG: Uma2 family endonuclease [Spirochaetales bacterium]|nr:Uma2 family endonuclease [Spirochaetales bacterium]
MGALKKEDHVFTYADYLRWNDDQRWEILEGCAYNMSPAPSRNHQKISGSIFNRFFNYLNDKTCEVYAAPIDVRLCEPGQQDEDIITVVQPDILVCCDSSKLDDKGIKGSPDLIIEITSPSTASLDLKTKYQLYQKYGVKEYWIVNPLEESIMLNFLGADGLYAKPEFFAGEDSIQPRLFHELLIDLNEIFSRPEKSTEKQPPRLP